jgi:hypothetical protein
MIITPTRGLIAAGVLALAILAGPYAQAAADIEKHLTRTSIAGIDVIAYRTGIKDVVTVLG